MSQSRFSIVLVGVSALLRRPLVSRLRPADGGRSPWVVFTARGGRFDSGFRSAVGSSAFRFGICRSAGWSSGSLLPLFGMRRFGDCPRRVGLRAHDFRFSARTVSEWPSAGWFFRSAGWRFCLPFRRLPLGELAFGLTASAFLHAPFRGCHSAVGLRAYCFGDCHLASWPSGSLLLLFGMRRFGDSAGRVRSFAFRFGVAVRRVGLRAHGFRFSARTASEWLLGEFVLPPSASEIALGGLVLPLVGLAFGLTASAFRHAPLRKLPSAGWPSGSRLPLFGMHRFAPPHRRSEDRRSTPTRHLFHFKTLIPTC